MKTDSSKAVHDLVAALRRACAKLPAAEEYVMVHHPAFRVGKKPFAIVGMGQAENRATLSINLGRDAQHQLLDDARFTRTSYIGQHGWVTIGREDLEKGELDMLVTDSYRRVANASQLSALDARGAAKPAKRGRKKKA